MVKRRRTKASVPAKTKANGKDKALEPSHRKETSNKNAKINLDSQEIIDDNPSGKKKPKLNSNQSPKSERYVPPFTTSQRVSARLRKARLNCEKSERQSAESCSKESIEDASTDVSKRPREKENLDEKSQRKTSDVVLGSCKSKTDKMASTTSNDTSQNDIEIKVEVIGEKQFKQDIKDDENISEKLTKTSENLQKQSEIDVQVIESAYDKPKGENNSAPDEMGRQISQKEFQLLPDHSYAKQNSCDQTEIDGEREKEKQPLNFVGEKIETSKKCLVSNTEMSLAVQGQQSDNMTKLAANVTDPGTSDFRALNNDAMSFLADRICVEKQYNSDGEVEEELCSGGSSQYRLWDSIEKEGNVKEMNGKEEDYEEEGNSNLEKFAQEKTSNKVNNVILELLQDVITDVVETNNQTSEKRRCMVSEKKPPNEINNNSGDKSDVILEVDETMNKSSFLSSQEVVKAKLSEMIAFVSENELNGQLSPQVRLGTRRTIGSNPEKNLGDANGESVVVTSSEMMSITGNFGGEQSLEENSSVKNSDKHSQNTTKPANAEIEQHEKMAVDGECYSCVIENLVEDETIKQDGVVTYNQNSQEATTVTEIVANEVSSEITRDTAGKMVDERIPNEDVCENDQEVPDKVIKSPEQEVPVRFTSPSSSSKDKNCPTIQKDKGNVKAFNHEEEAMLKKDLTTCICHNESRELETTEETKIDITTPDNTIDEQSYTEEFKALEELLPTDDMGLFDDIICQPKSISDLPSGDSTIEFLINELGSLRCVVANYERALDDVKKLSNRRF